MPTLIPLSKTNPFVRSIQRLSAVNLKTDVFSVGYDCQLICIIEGHGFLQYPQGYLSLRPGTVAIINPCVPHNIITYSGEKLIQLKLNFDYTQNSSSQAKYIPCVPEKLFVETKVTCDTLPSDVPYMRGCMCISNMQHIGSSLLGMLDMYEKKQCFCDALLSAQAKMLICELFASIINEKSKAGNRIGAELINDVITYLDIHYMEQISNADIAEYLNYHPNYLNKQIVRYTGRSLHQHLITYRIARATELLLFSKATITDIAQSTGFQNVSHFSRVFQQNFECSPSSLRSLYSDSSNYALKAFKSLAKNKPGNEF